MGGPAISRPSAALYETHASPIKLQHNQCFSFDTIGHIEAPALHDLTSRARHEPVFVCRHPRRKTAGL